MEESISESERFSLLPNFPMVETRMYLTVLISPSFAFCFAFSSASPELSVKPISASICFSAERETSS